MLRQPPPRPPRQPPRPSADGVGLGLGRGAAARAGAGRNQRRRPQGGKAAQQVGPVVGRRCARPPGGPGVREDRLGAVGPRDASPALPLEAGLRARRRFRLGASWGTGRDKTR
eukprot:1344039-Pyramimonas_sp.AAC.1